MRRRALTLSLLAPLAIPASGEARPRTTYVPVSPDRAGIEAPTAAPGSRIIYLNRCEGGCTVRPGYDDSILDRSSIIDATVELSPFALGDEAWADVVACVRQMYAPFDVEITDEDPGSVPHFEALVAGDPDEAGFPEHYGGVAPFGCGVIENAITYTFANAWSRTRQICDAVAQETAHSFGLDHELLCSDPMTYLLPCGRRSFRDEDADCGEDEPRECYCGGTTQNSYRHLLDLFGEGDAPRVAIAEPSDGATVPPGFRVSADQAPPGIERVELLIDGELIGSGTVPPYIFRAPTRLAQGEHRVELLAYDDRGVSGSTRVTVHQSPCERADACSDGEACVSGSCILGPDMPGGLGDTCEGSGDCSSGLCGKGDSGAGICAAPCDPAQGDCPGGFACLDSGGESVCWPKSSGGCAAGGGAETPFALLLALALFLRRRPTS